MADFDDGYVVVVGVKEQGKGQRITCLPRGLLFDEAAVSPEKIQVTIETVYALLPKMERETEE